MIELIEFTKISGDDLSFLAEELSKINNPLHIQELTRKLAFKKAESQMNQAVKKYDPYCKYEVGDIVYKEYNEPLMVSSKGTEMFTGAVVLKVIKKISYENFNCEMLEVDFSGGGTFRKHIDYMKKTKTQVLIPSSLEGKAKTPEVLNREEDPRLHELPMTEKDLKSLEKNLKGALAHSSQFFNWSHYWQLKEKCISISEEKIKEIENHLLETKESMSTEDMVVKYFKQKPASDLFELYCLSLNHCLEKKHKKKFVFVFPEKWGKWHLKKVLESFTENLPLLAPKAALPYEEGKQISEITTTNDFPLKIYLTWREILSGGIKIPEKLSKNLSHCIEYIFTDTEMSKDYIVYYYPSLCIFLGLKEFFETHNVPQGASLTLERQGITKFNFWMKKTKKKFSVSKVTYDPKADQFALTGEEMFSFFTPNKIIHIECETLEKLFTLYDNREGIDLRELLILIYKNFGIEKDNKSLHYLRAFHLVDMLKQTTQEDVEMTLLSFPEFVPSEKKKGIFIYEEKIKTEEEIIKEEPVEIPVEMEPLPIPETPSPPVSSVSTIEPAEEEIEEIQTLEAIEAPPAPKEEEFVERPKKEKEFKKKKHRIELEAEKAPRKRKGAKKFIEERIELEEFEQEAMIAVKAKEKKETEEELDIKTEKKGKVKPFSPQGPVFGVFAEKLKSALDQKDKGKKKKQEK